MYFRPLMLCHLQPILPTTITKELTYYESLCKLVKIVNDVIVQQKITTDEINAINKELARISEFVENFDYHFLNTILAKYFNFAIFLEITDAGYIVYNIPESWKDINFNTVGLDISIPDRTDLSYGTLVLSY